MSREGTMTEKDAIEILRAQGHALGTPGPRTIRLWVHGTSQAIDVERGHELIYLAEGKLSVEELLARRETEHAAKH